MTLRDGAVVAGEQEVIAPGEAVVIVAELAESEWCLAVSPKRLLSGLVSLHFQERS
jgi:hypothetical protein